MSYIEDTLMKNEKILYHAKPHWIIFAWPVVWCLIAILFFIFGPNIMYADIRVTPNLPLYAAAALVAIALAIITAIISFINYQSSEYGVTNKRVLMKVGFIRRLALEIYLRKIESVKVYQSVLGRILGYGSIMISGVGGTKDPFTNIPDPLMFRRKIQERIETLDEIPETNHA